MKQLLPVLVVLFLFGAVLWAQSAADSTVFAQLDTLIAQEKFSEASTRIAIVRDAQLRADYWEFVAEKINEKADKFLESGKYRKALAVLDSGMFQLTRAKLTNSLLAADLWSWKATTYRKLEQYSDVLDAYNEAIRLFEIYNPHSSSLVFCYKNAAQSYMRRQDYQQADKYLRAALRHDTTGKYRLSIYGQLANNAYWQDSLDAAWQYVELGKNVDGADQYRASMQATAANILIKKLRWREAETLKRQALDFYKSRTDESENRIRCYTALAEIAAHTGRPAEAGQFYRQAEIEGERYFKKGKSREMAKLYCEWGDFLLRENREKEALLLYQKALVQAYPNFNNLDPATNPDPAEAPVELWAMNAPARKAALLLRAPSPETRLAAAGCFECAFAAAERLRSTYGTDEAKLYFTQHNYDLRREAVRNLWALHRETSENTHLERLFDLLENGRANTLRDALQKQRALALTGIPDSLLHLEDALRREIAKAQTQLTEAQTAGDTSGIFDRRQAALAQLEHRYSNLFTVLNKNYPRFREFNRAGKTADRSAISKALPEHATLLAYFDTGDQYLCLVLHQNKLTACEIQRDSVLNQTLARFQLLLTDKQQQEADPAAYFADAFLLKQRLLPEALLQNTTALVIIPDGRLAYLPFEALLTKPHTGSYGAAPYLLRKYSVQYAWSAALLTDDPVRSEKAARSLLQMAPFATTSRNDLAKLPNSLQEKPEDVQVDMLSGMDANAGKFLKIAARYDVLHLSTHAHAGQHEQPGIEFYDRVVALPEIYAQRLNATLVALSACETNTGAFAEGEGVLSLARAFAYAGARSLVASYWSVNDRSTANLFVAFYRHLKNGLPKSEALRRAKLDLLEAAGFDARKAPYHWAAFTLSGADGVVELEEEGWNWWVWVLAIFGLGVFFLLPRLTHSRVFSTRRKDVG